MQIAPSVIIKVSHNTLISLIFKAIASVESKMMVIAEQAVVVKPVIRCTSLSSVEMVVVDIRLKREQR